MKTKRRQVISRAGRVKGLGLLLVVGVIMGVLYAAYYWQRDAEAARLVDELLRVETTGVKDAIEKLAEYQAWANDDLAIAFAESADDSTAKLHAGLALLSQDPSVLPFLRERLLSVAPAQFAIVRDLLYPQREQLIERYTELCQDVEHDSARRFQAACALASYDSEGDLWHDDRFCQFVADYLTQAPPADLSTWRDALRGVKEQLSNPLIAIYRNRDAEQRQRTAATAMLADYWSDDPARLFDLAADADMNRFPVMFDALASHRQQAIQLAGDEIARTLSADSDEHQRATLAMRQANAAVMLLRMGSADQVWPLLRHSPDPTVRNYLIDRIGPLGVDPKTIIARYQQEPDHAVRRALLLVLGEFVESELPQQDRASLMESLLGDYQTDPDPGLHSTVGWLLEKWGMAERLASIDRELQQSEQQLRNPDDDRRGWYVNGQGQTFAILDAGELQVGSPSSVRGSEPKDERYWRRIGRRLAVSTTEVARAQWRVFDESSHASTAIENPASAEINTEDSPMVGITWYEAAEYCNWLSQQEGIPEDQWCYQPHPQRGYAAGMKAKEFFWELTGYRLPTEAEWELACRAAQGSLKPNEFGLFDIQANVAEWCYDADGHHGALSGPPVADASDTSAIEESVSFRPVRTYHSYALDRLRRAHSLARNREFDQAVEAYRRSVKELPITGAHFGLAKALHGSGEFDEARAEFEFVLKRLSKEAGEAILRRPQSLDGVRFSIADVLVSLAELEGDAGDRLEEKNRWRTFVETLEQTPEPENPSYWSFLGQGLYRLGRMRESRQAMEKAISLRGEAQPPLHGGARWWFLTMALGRLGEVDKAWELYDQLVEEMWENPSAATVRYQAEAAEILGVNPWTSTGEF